MFRSFATICMAMILVTTGGAYAGGPPAETVQIRRIAVRVGDLDQSRSHDAEILSQRIRTATDRACGGHPAMQNLHPALMQQMKDYRRCRNAAEAEAVATLRSMPVARQSAAAAPNNIAP